MIVGMKQNISLVVKAVPETKMKGKLASLNIEESIKSLDEVGFQVRAVICDSHPSKVTAFRDLSQKFSIWPDKNAISSGQKCQK